MSQSSIPRTEFGVFVGTLSSIQHGLAFDGFRPPRDFDLFRNLVQKYCFWKEAPNVSIYFCNYTRQTIMDYPLGQPIIHSLRLNC